MMMNGIVVCLHFPIPFLIALVSLSLFLSPLSSPVPSQEHHTSVNLQRSITSMFFNACSIMNKHLDFMSLISTNKLDVIGVYETFLDSSIFDSEITSSGYTVYRADRNRYGGGLLIAVVNALQSVCHFDLERLDIELLWIQIFSGTSSVLFGVAYRPPSSSFEFVKSLAASLQLIPPNLSIYLCGDFNLPLVNWAFFRAHFF